MNGYRIETGGHNTGVRIEDFRPQEGSANQEPQSNLLAYRYAGRQDLGDTALETTILQQPQPGGEK